jgi:hypothetical protein
VCLCLTKTGCGVLGPAVLREDHGGGRSTRREITARIVEGGQVGEDTLVRHDMLFGDPGGLGDGRRSSALNMSTRMLRSRACVHAAVDVRQCVSRCKFKVMLYHVRSLTGRKARRSVLLGGARLLDGRRRRRRELVFRGGVIWRCVSEYKEKWLEARLLTRRGSSSRRLPCHWIFRFRLLGVPFRRYTRTGLARLRHVDRTRMGIGRKKEWSRGVEVASWIV